MQSSRAFNDTIKAHLQALADKDPLFAETLKKPNKNIADCATYILNEVKRLGQNGFADSEIYAMAVHYYDEDDIKVGDAPSNARVIVNHVVELTQEEKDEARKTAVERVISEEKQRLTKKPVKKAEAPAQSQSSLF